MTDTRLCRYCNVVKPITDFYTRRNRLNPNLRHPFYRCKKCDSKLGTIASRKRRLNPDNRAKYVLKDSRKSDGKKGLINDLTLEYVATAISKPCSYCDSSKVIMTLDRVDNNVGHTIDNTVPSCVRCNYIKSNMPHEAWMALVPGIRKAVRLGLFGDWRTLPFNRKKPETS